MNIGVCVSFLIRILLFSRYMPRCGMSSVENLFMCLMAVYMTSLKKYLGIISKLQKQLIQLNNNSKKPNPIKNWAKDQNRYFSKEDMCVCVCVCAHICVQLFVTTWILVLEIPHIENPDRLQSHTFKMSWTRQSTYVPTHAHVFFGEMSIQVFSFF